MIEFLIVVGIAVGVLVVLGLVLFGFSRVLDAIDLNAQDDG
jgi:hypothetical protein